MSAAASRYRIAVKRDTAFKLLPLQSAELDARLWVSVRAGTQLESVTEPVYHNDRQHLQIVLPRGSLGYAGVERWYVYAPHVEVEGTDPNNRPADAPPPPAVRSGLQLPDGSAVELQQPILPGGHFTWAEATHNGSRVPATVEVVANIRRIAAALREVRHRLGDEPLRVTSWYRPPQVNRMVGGSPNSRHIQGDAVDFAHPRLSPREVYERLNAWWNDRGGLAYGAGFVHIDARGYQARWRYPGV